MFIVRVLLKIRAEQQPALRTFVLSETESARRLPGCVKYLFSEDIADPLSILLYEEWATRRSFEAYRASEIFAASGTQLRPLLAAPPDSAYYESDDVFASCAIDLPA